MKRIIILLMGISLFALLATSCKSFADSQETTSSGISDSSFNDTPIESMEESSDELMDSTEDLTEESTNESSDEESDTWQDENVDNSGGWT